MRGPRGIDTEPTGGPRGIVTAPIRGCTAILTALAVLALTAGPARASVVRATSILPPGESGFVSVLGVTSGTGSPNLYDQQQPFIDFHRKDAMLGQSGTSQSPRAGITIVRDSFGVPAVTGATSGDLWWGAGYATAQDRLFELEVFRRATTGHLAEVLGPSYLPMDIQTRRDFYTSGELDRMTSALPKVFRDRYSSYLAGINAWVDHVNGNPSDMPGEFVAVGLVPVKHFTLEEL